jgi:hypothetical protein
VSDLASEEGDEKVPDTNISLHSKKVVAKNSPLFQVPTCEFLPILFSWQENPFPQNPEIYETIVPSNCSPLQLERIPIFKSIYTDSFS